MGFHPSKITCPKKLTFLWKRNCWNKVTLFYILEYSNILINSLFCSADLSRNSLTWSEGMAKEIPGVTFMVFIPITSPSWFRPHRKVSQISKYVGKNQICFCS